MRTAFTIALAGALLLAAATAAQARIKLTTLPERESVRVDIQNGRYTLVEEERTVSAEKAGPAVIRISYLIANMAAEPSYQGIVENDEKSLLMQVYMTVSNTSGESFGETIVQPGVGKTAVRYFNDGERKRMLAAKFADVPIAKRYVFDAAVDQERTRMYYRLTNDKENQMGGFPLPYGKVRLFIKEPKSDGDAVRSQAFLGEDWAQYTPLFAPLDLYVGVAQDVKVERFTMDPEGGPKAVFDEITVPRFTLDGKEGVTKPQFRNLRTRYRYRLQNFKTEKADPIAVPLSIKEHLDGQWTIEKVVLKEILGERNEQKEKEIPYAELFNPKRIDVNNVEFEVKLPPTTIDKKYDLYVTILKKYRRY